MQQKRHMLLLYNNQMRQIFAAGKPRKVLVVKNT